MAKHLVLYQNNKALVFKYTVEKVLISFKGLLEQAVGVTCSSRAAGCIVMKQLLALWIDLAGRINIPLVCFKLLYLMKPSEEGNIKYHLVLF